MSSDPFRIEEATLAELIAERERMLDEAERVALRFANRRQDARDGVDGAFENMWLALGGFIGLGMQLHRINDKISQKGG